MTAVIDEPLTWRNIVDHDFYLEIPEPVYLGPTWATDDDGDFLMPEFTLGWQVIHWVERNLLNDEGQPFQLTDEQKRLLLWWYAVDERGRFVYRKGILQRLKGWGKDPFAAVLAAVEFVGPCRFAGWLTVDRPDLGLIAGDPLGKEHPRAWIQVAAVSKDQTVNTMALFPGLFSRECIKEHQINMGKEIIYAHGGQRRIQAVTSSPRALEGGRPTLVIKNETHHWLQNNEGHAMASVIDRNATKSKDGQSRTLSITNAYEPSEGSVAQREREAWEDEQAGLSINTGVLYDSIEAGKDALMALPKKPTGEVDEDGNPVEIDPTEDEIKAYIGAIVNAIRGDASWLDVDSIVGAILDKANDVSESRRFYYNQVVAAEDAWLDPAAIRAAVSPAMRESMADNADIRTGWLMVLPSDPVVLFLDCSKSQDSTALVGCRLDDGYVFTVGVWQRPPGERGDKWLAPREEVDSRLIECMGFGTREDGTVDDNGRFNVVAFWGDPSHALDDEDGSRYWDALFDRWHQRYKHRLQLWAHRGEHRQHAVMWDMTSPERHHTFVDAAERFNEEIENLNDIEMYEPLFEIDGHPALVRHLANAKRYPTKWGTSLWKGAREGTKKIDLAVAAVGARMVRRMMTNKGLEEEEQAPAELWGRWTGLGADQYTEGRW